MDYQAIDEYLNEYFNYDDYDDLDDENRSIINSNQLNLNINLNNNEYKINTENLENRDLTLAIRNFRNTYHHEFEKYAKIYWKDDLHKINATISIFHSKIKCINLIGLFITLYIKNRLLFPNYLVTFDETIKQLILLYEPEIEIEKWDLIHYKQANSMITKEILELDVPKQIIIKCILKIMKKNYLLNNEQLFPLIKKYINKYKENIKCIICLDNLDIYINHLSCGHIFHSDCINNWSYNSDSCPICRNDIYL